MKCTVNQIAVLISCVAEFTSAASTGLHFGDGPIKDVNAWGFKTQVLDSNVTTVALVYANWCSHSKKFAPEILKVAKRERAAHPDINWVGVDCGDYYNYYQLCKRYQLNDYPDVQIFMPQEVADALPEKSDVTNDDLWHTNKKVIHFPGGPEAEVQKLMDNVVQGIQLLHKRNPRH